VHGSLPGAGSWTLRAARDCLIFEGNVGESHIYIIYLPCLPGMYPSISHTIPLYSRRQLTFPQCLIVAVKAKKNGPQK